MRILTRDFRAALTIAILALGLAGCMGGGPETHSLITGKRTSGTGAAAGALAGAGAGALIAANNCGGEIYCSAGVIALGAAGGAVAGNEVEGYLLPEHVPRDQMVWHQPQPQGQSIGWIREEAAIGDCTRYYDDGNGQRWLAGPDCRENSGYSDPPVRRRASLGAFTYTPPTIEIYRRGQEYRGSGRPGWEYRRKRSTWYHDGNKYRRDTTITERGGSWEKRRRQRRWQDPFPPVPQPVVKPQPEQPAPKPVKVEKPLVEARAVEVDASGKRCRKVHDDLYPHAQGAC